MTDHELDEMLNQWDVPPMRESVREQLRTEFIAMPARPRREGPKIRISRLAVATLAAAALLFTLVQVSPRTVRMASPGYRIPFYVEFEFARYADDGSRGHTSWIKSFPYGGYEVAMSVRESGDSFLNVFRNIASSVRDRFVLAIPELVTSKMRPLAEPAWLAGYVKSGCSEGKTVVGHEIIAGHATTVIESRSPGYRMRFWMAPGLNCFTLKMTEEAQQPNGVYRLKMRKEALQVTMNP